MENPNFRPLKTLILVLYSVELSVMDLEGLSTICAGLGSIQEDNDGNSIGYTRAEFCLGIILSHLWFDLQFYFLFFFLFDSVHSLPPSNLTIIPLFADSLKDLQRFLRRDDPQTRDVFKQVCKWSTVSKDLVPIIEHCQDNHVLVINAGFTLYCAIFGFSPFFVRS